MLQSQAFKTGGTMNRIRQERIKKYIESRNVATIKELRELFPDVSLMTCTVT